MFLFTVRVPLTIFGCGIGVNQYYTCNFSFYVIFLCSYTAINGRTHSRKINLYGYSYGTDLFSLSPALCVKLYK